MTVKRFIYLSLFLLTFQLNKSYCQQSCIDLGVGIGVSNDEIALIDFFKNGGKWEVVGSNNHPWYKVYSLDTFKVVNGAYYHWDIDWSGTVNNEAWGNNWADSYISFWDMMMDQGKIRPDGYPNGFPTIVYKYKPKSADPNQGLDMTKPVNINGFSRRIYFPNGLPVDGWVMKWKGKGRISFEGLEVTSANVTLTDNGESWKPDASSPYAGRNYEFNSKTTGTGRVVCRHFWMIHGFVLNILESDPTDPIRDVVFLHPGLESNYDAGQRFTPLFLERMKQFKCLRYMGYLNSNGIESRVTMASSHPYHETHMIDWLRWNERTPNNYYAINNGNGGNYEYIIDLSNQTGTDPWVNIPYCAGDAYADSLVRLFMEKLNPDRTLYLEIGNEMWNYAPGFDGFFWQAAKRVTEYPGLGDVEARGAHVNRIFKQVTETAGPRNLPRIQRVVGAFPRYYDVNNRTVQMVNPAYWDALATTWYFGLDQDNTSSNACRDPQSGTNWRTVLYNWFLAHPNDQPGFNQTYRNCVLNEFRCNGGYRNNVDVVLANYYSKKLVCYEGGNHTFYGCTNNANSRTELPGGEDRIWANAVYPNYITNNPFVNAVCVADESPEIGQVFSEVIDSMQSAGITLANHLNFSGTSSCYGVWDLIQARDIEAPLATLLARYNKFKVFSDRIKNDNCTQVKITLSPDTVGPGLSIKMDGIDDYIEGQAAYIPDESANYTLETWVKPYLLDREQVALSFSSDGANDNYNVIKLRTDKKVVWEIGNNGAFTAKLIGPELEINKWYHIAVTKNGNRYTLYANGVKVADNNYTLPVSTRNKYTIGAFYKGSTCQNFFGGEIDEVRLWNTARTQDDIREYMCKKVPANYSQFSQLKSYYRFDYPDYTGSTLFDFVNRRATGRLHNITITERSRYAVSGAPVGDYSKYIYPSAWSGVSLSLTHPQGDRVAAYNIVNGIPAGIHVYMIDGRSHYNDAPEYYTDISDKRVAGVFIANGDNTNYDISYIYQGNPDVTTGGGANNLRLLRRDDFSIENWLHAGARISNVANSLTVPCKEKYRGEYNIAHRPSIDQVRPGSGKALLDNQTPTGNVMGKVQYLDMEDFTVTFWAKGWGEVFNFTSKLQDNACRFTVTDRGNGNIGCGLRYGVYWTYDMSFGPNSTIGKNTEWHHYAVTKSGTKMRIYVDGMEASSADVTSTFHIQELYLFNAPAWQKGNFPGGVANMTLDELSVWNIPLDQNTIRDWMCKKVTQAHPNECKNLVLYFNFDENQGNVLEDKRGPSDIVLKTDGSGFRWVSSGAAIGDVSVADFTSPENITLAHPDGDYLEANRTAGSSFGVNLYRINNIPPDPSTVSGSSIHSLDSSRYWGIFVSKSNGVTTNYSVIDHYEHNSQVKLAAETELRLLSRTDNSVTPWSPNANVTPDITQHTLTLTNQPRGEYVLGGTSANTFNSYIAPVQPIFLTKTETINRDTICGNSTGLLFKLQHDPYAESYVWTLPPELDGYSTSDSIIINSSYIGSTAITYTISVKAINAYGQSPVATYNIRVLPRPTVSDAGPDQILTTQITAIMAANSPVLSEIATWYLTGGLGTIVGLNNPTSQINDLGTGRNSFAWTITNGICPPSSDTTRIIVAPSPQNIVLQNGDPLPAIVCQGEVLTLRVIPPEDILPDSYSWTLPSGFTLVSQNGNEETIIAGNGIGGSISVSAIYSGRVSIPYTSKPISISALPNKPVFADRPPTLCLNVTDTASVQYTATTDSLVWTLPTGIYPTVFPKSTSELIAIKALQVVSGYIKVQSYNHGCTNLAATDSFLVNVRQAPAKPDLYLGTDGGTADADCANQSLLLWVRDPDNAVTYEWTWSTDVSFTKYFNDNRSGILLTVKDGNANIYARAVSGTGECSASEWYEFYSWPQPQGPAQVTGVTITSPTGQAPLALVVGQTYTFHVAGNADHYYWNVPVGFELVSDDDLSDDNNNIRVTSATAGVLEVFPITLRGCAGTPFQLNIGVSGALLPPTYFSGATKVCQGTTLHIYVSAVNGATQYIWSLPDNTTYTTAIPELNITPANAVKGIMTVVAKNASTQSQPSEIPITIQSTFLSKPSFIDAGGKPVSELEICSGDYNKPIYIKNNLASQYIWAINGSAIQFEPRNQPGHENDQNYELRNRTSPIDTMMPISWVDWRCKKDGADGGYIVVLAKNGCGGLNTTDSIHYYWAQPLTLFVPEFTKAPQQVCIGSKANFEIKPILGATQYIWSLPSGLVTSDATTLTPSITADVVNGTGGTVKVFATSAVCGGTQTIENSSNTITISGAPVDFHFIDHPTAACPGTPLTYSVNDIGAGTYTWTLPGGLRTTQVDDGDATGVTISGSWSVEPRTNLVNGSYHSTNNDNINKKITYRPNIPYTGRYKVSLSYYTDWDTRADVPVTLNSASGASNQFVNMSIAPSDGIWQSLGEFDFTAGSAGSVIIGAQASGGSLSIADAVKFELLGISTNNTSITIPAQQGEGGAVCVSATIPQCAAPYTICTDPINLAGTLTTPIITQQESSVCTGLTYTYRVNDSGADSYTWHLPPGMSIGGITGRITGLGREVNVRMDSNTGAPVKIGVHGVINSCNVKSDSVYTTDIVFNGTGCKLSNPVFTTQPNGMCQGGNATFVATIVQYADSYQWTLPVGLRQSGTMATGIFTTTVPTINVEPDGTPTGSLGRITVQAISSTITNSDVVSTTNPVSISTPPSFTTTATNTTRCDLTNGSINLASLNANTAYSINYYNGSQTVGPVALTSNAVGTIQISNLGAGNYSNIVVEMNGCAATRAGILSISAPPIAQVTNVSFTNPVSCGSSGIVNITLSGATDGNTYYIDFDNDGTYNDTAVVASDALALDLPGGTSISQLALTESTTGCQSSSPATGVLTDPSAVSISKILLLNPSMCGDSAVIKIALVGAIESDGYFIDYDNDGRSDKFGHVAQDTLIVYKVPVTTNINNIVIANGTTGCRTFQSYTGTFNDLIPAIIRSVELINPATCGGQGAIKIALAGATNNSTYSIDYNGDGAFDNSGTVALDTITLSNISVGTSVSQLLIRNTKTACESTTSASGTITRPFSANITNVLFTNPTLCGGKGSIQIVLSGALSGGNYSIDYDNNGVADTTGTVIRDTITLNRIPVYTAVNNLTVTSTTTGCPTTSTFNGRITNPNPLWISDVQYISPTLCGETGSVRVALVGASPREFFSIDYNSNGSFDDTCTSNSGIVLRDGLTVDQTINGLTLLSSLSHCLVTSSLVGTIHPPNDPGVTLTSIGDMCENSPEQPLEGGLPTGGIYTIDGNTSSSIDPLNLGVGNHTVIYKYVAPNNCFNSDTIDFFINPTPNVLISGEVELCPGSMDIPYSVPYYGQNSYTWSIVGGTKVDGIDAANIRVNWTDASSGDVKILVTNTLTNCIDSSLVTVRFSDAISPLVTRCLSAFKVTATKDEIGKFYIIKPQDTTYIPMALDMCTKTNLQYTFTINNGAETNTSQFIGTRLNDTDPTTIRWKVYDQSGNMNDECLSTVIFEYELKVPSAFSPNSDNVNDAWEIDFLSDYPESIVKVYNRWGMLVFESQDGYKNNWNGTCKGKLLPVDSYYYVISLGKDSKVLTGYLTIVY